MSIIKDIFQKNSPRKLFVSLIVVVLSLVCISSFDKGQIIFAIIGAPFALWIILFTLIMTVYAWFVNPISFLIKKFKK